MKSKLAKKKDDYNSSYWLKKADEAWGELIHRKGRCTLGNLGVGECAGKLEAHHFISRSVRCLRHDPRNGDLLCSLHHKYSTIASPHMAPLQYAMIIEAHFPETWEWIKSNKWKTGKFNYRDAYELLQIELCKQ